MAFDNNTKDFERTILRAVINCKTGIVDLEQKKNDMLIKEMNDKCDKTAITEDRSWRS